VGLMKVLQEVRRELKETVEEKYLRNNQQFFKEKIKCYGVRTPIVRKIAKTYFKEVKPLGKKKVFELCEQLLANKYTEEATVAIQWAGALKPEFEEKDFKIFENWLKKYIDNWGKTDDFCLHVIHPLIEKYPLLVEKVKPWTRSKNRWLRRASAVSFITTSGQYYTTGQNLKDVFYVALALLKDEDDLVQKGYGWMLKAASVTNPKKVFEFVMEHKQEMPRTALRYAIEKYPQEMRKEALRK